MKVRKTRKRLQRSRIKSTRGIRRLLACLGVVTCLLGFGLFLASFFDGNRKLGSIGVIYLLAGTALLGLRQAVHSMEHHAKRRHRKREAEE